MSRVSNRILFLRKESDVMLSRLLEADQKTFKWAKDQNDNILALVVADSIRSIKQVIKERSR